MQRPVVSEVSAATLEEFKKADETVFIAFLSADDEASKTAFTNVAGRYREEFTFGMVTEDAALKAEEATPPIVKCFKPLDGDTHDFREVSDVAALEGFVKEASRPVIAELLPHTHQRLLDVSKHQGPLPRPSTDIRPITVLTERVGENCSAAGRWSMSSLRQRPRDPRSERSYIRWRVAITRA